MGKVLRSPVTIISGILSFVLWFTKETTSDWFFDKVLHEAVMPHWGAVVEYGPPVAFALICIGVIIRQQKTAETPQRKTFADMAKVMYPKRMQHLERIGVLDFYKQAQQSGVSLMGGGHVAYQLSKDIRQAALDGTLRTWGKTDSLGGPLVPIQPDHWRDFRLYWEQCFKIVPPEGRIEGFADDNSLVGTSGARTTSGGRRGYVDVHLDAEQAKELIERLLNTHATTLEDGKTESVALEILFDPANPGRRFWTLESVKREDGSRAPVWEYRIDVRNVSQRTLRNVKVTAELVGIVGNRPKDVYFDKTGTRVADINPGCSELVRVLWWPHPPRQAGMLVGRTGYGPLIITASAEDVPATKKRFEFDYDKAPMIWE